MVNQAANSQVASLASQGLFDPASLTADDVRAICATALAQVPDHRQNEMVQARPFYEQIDMALAMARLRNSEKNRFIERVRCLSVCGAGGALSPRIQNPANT